MLPGNLRKTNRNDDGYSLIAVLVFCFVLIPVIASFAQSSRSSARNVQATIQTAKIEFLENGLADIVASKLSFDADFSQQLADAAAISCRIGDLLVTIDFRDHDGKVDINNANSMLLKAGFLSAGFTDERASLLQAFVEASRSGVALSDELTGRSELPTLKGAPFERVEELNDAIVALKLPLANLEPYFTVYKRSGNLEISTASARLKEVLGDASQTGDFAENNNSFEYIDVSVNASAPRLHRSYPGLSKSYRREMDQGMPREIARKYLPNDDDKAAVDDDHAKADCADWMGIDRSAFLDG